MNSIGTYNERPVYIEQYETLSMFDGGMIEGMHMLFWLAEGAWLVEHVVAALADCVRGNVAALALAGAKPDDCLAILFDVIDLFETEPATALAVMADRPIAEVVQRFLAPAAGETPESSAPDMSPPAQSPPPPATAYRLIVVGAAESAAPVRAAFEEHARSVLGI